MEVWVWVTGSIYLLCNNFSQLGIDSIVLSGILAVQSAFTGCELNRAPHSHTPFKEDYTPDRVITFFNLFLRLSLFIYLSCFTATGRHSFQNVAQIWIINNIKFMFME